MMRRTKAVNNHQYYKRLDRFHAANFKNTTRMDAAFLPNNEGGRANFIQHLVQHFGSSYICLWSYLPLPSNCLIYLDGLYQLQEENTELSTSSLSGRSSSLARRLFDEYRNSLFELVQHENVPGYAFKNNLPCIQLEELELTRFASNQIQVQFYQEAGIKTAVFMGCNSGEIEIGWSTNNVPQAQINTKTEMIKSWFVEGFPTQSLQVVQPITDQEINNNPISRPIVDIQNNPPASSTSSSSLRSLDSPEYYFNINPSTTTSSTTAQLDLLISQHHPISSSYTNRIKPQQQAIEAIIFAQMRNTQYPVTPGTEVAAMTKAILSVLSSSSSSSSSSSAASSHQRHQNLPHRTSAFKNYSSSSLAPTTQISAHLRRQRMIKRSISFFRNLNFMRIHQRLQATEPTTTQLHHMISERKRREKLNESFKSLRSILPTGTKKDKASMLTTAREYLGSFKAQITELNNRNQQLKEQLLRNNNNNLKDEDSSNLEQVLHESDQRVVVRLQRISESTSEEAEIFDLQVILRTNRPVEGVVIRILEFLKQLNNVSFMSMEANTHLTQSIPINFLTLRLQVEEISEWDETTFREAVRRAIADLAQ